jgi:hypothetical protein
MEDAMLGAEEIKGTEHTDKKQGVSGGAACACHAEDSA